MVKASERIMVLSVPTCQPGTNSNAESDLRKEEFALIRHTCELDLSGKNEFHLNKLSPKSH